MPNLYCMHSFCIKEDKASDHNYLGDFLIVKPPESLAIEERFIVEWEYTLFSLVPTKGKELYCESKPRGNKHLGPSEWIQTTYQWIPWRGYERGWSHPWKQS